jgi:hypothetical protein
MVYFKTKKRFGYILEGLWRENVGIFHGHWVQLLTIWYNIWPFGIVCGHFVYFCCFGMFGPRKIWQPWDAALNNEKWSIWDFRLIYECNLFCGTSFKLYTSKCRYHYVIAVPEPYQTYVIWHWMLCVFTYPNSQFWYIFEDLEIKNFLVHLNAFNICKAIWYTYLMALWYCRGHLVCFVAIWCILWLFGIF